MQKNLLVFLIVFLSISLSAQTRLAKGTVKDKKTGNPVEDVQVQLIADSNYVLTNSKGKFEIDFPKGQKQLIFRKENYSTYTFTIGRHIHPANSIKKIKVRIVPDTHKNMNKIWRSNKNAISLSLMEIFIGSLGLRYERFIKEKHSIGMHLSWYFSGYNTLPGWASSNNVNYDGIKFAPFYRYYPIRTDNTGLYLEAKIPFGYFDFNELTYESNGYLDNVPAEFSTVGFGIAVGWMFKLGRGNHGFGNLSVGYQYFPMDVPSSTEYTYEDETYTLDLDNKWWYTNGPGARFEFKLTLGGLF